MNVDDLPFGLRRSDTSLRFLCTVPVLSGLFVRLGRSVRGKASIHAQQKGRKYSSHSAFHHCMKSFEVLGRRMSSGKTYVEGWCVVRLLLLVFATKRKESQQQSEDTNQHMLTVGGIVVLCCVLFDSNGVRVASQWFMFHFPEVGCSGCSSLLDLLDAICLLHLHPSSFMHLTTCTSLVWPSLSFAEPAMYIPQQRNTQDRDRGGTTRPPDRILADSILFQTPRRCADKIDVHHRRTFEGMTGTWDETYRKPCSLFVGIALRRSRGWY